MKVLYRWLENLGYDTELYPVRSRLFHLSLHSQGKPVHVEVRDATQTDLDTRVNLMVVEKFGQEVKNSKSGYRLLYSFSDKTFGYTYAV